MKHPLALYFAFRRQRLQGRSGENERKMDDEMFPADDHNRAAIKIISLSLCCNLPFPLWKKQSEAIASLMRDKVSSLFMDSSREKRSSRGKL